MLTGRPDSYRDRRAGPSGQAGVPVRQLADTELRNGNPCLRQAGAVGVPPTPALQFVLCQMLFFISKYSSTFLFSL